MMIRLRRNDRFCPKHKTLYFNTHSGVFCVQCNGRIVMGLRAYNSKTWPTYLPLATRHEKGPFYTVEGRDGLFRRGGRTADEKPGTFLAYHMSRNGKSIRIRLKPVRPKPTKPPNRKKAASEP